MKLKAYHKWMLLILLFTGQSLSAQQVGTEIKAPADSVYQVPPDSLTLKKLQQMADSLLEDIQLRSCISLFSNHTVSSYLWVIGCNTLVLQGINVTFGGDLNLYVPDSVTINSVLDVGIGGSLSIDASLPINTIQSAINIGIFNISFTYSDSQNTVNFTNNYIGRPTNDVFYVFTITTPMKITIKHCDSAIDSYLHLLDNTGALIVYNDNYSGAGACSNTTHAYIEKYLAAGTYYIVSEGNNTNGIIKTTVTGEILQSGYIFDYDAAGSRISRIFIP